MNKQIKISTVWETHTDCAEIVEVFGQGCNYRTKFGVSGFIATASVTVEHDGESRTFECQFETAERTDNIRAYNGVDMTTSYDYGEQGELVEHLEALELFNAEFVLDGTGFSTQASEVMYNLVQSAEALCLQWLELNFIDVLKFPDVQTDIKNEFELYPYTLFNTKQVEHFMYEECHAELKHQFGRIADNTGVIFAVSESDVYGDLLQYGQMIVDEAFDNMGETDLTDEQLRENLGDTKTVFINIWYRALDDVDDPNSTVKPTSKDIYVAFCHALHELLYGANNSYSVNVWRVEQNEHIPEGRRASTKELCFETAQHMLNDFINKQG